MNMKRWQGRGVHLHEGEEPLSVQRVLNPKELGAALRRRRRELGYTQEMMAEGCGHSARVIGDIERGRATVEVGIVMEYAALLGVDIVLKRRSISDGWIERV